MFMDKNIGEKLYQHRKAAGFSQEELADKIGVSRQAVSKWEKGESSPDTENLIALSKLYNVSLDGLVFGEKAEEKPEEPQSENDKVDISPAGIHVESRTGDKVNIDLTGIHVDTADTNVHIDKNDVNVTENGHVVFPQKPIDSRAFRFLSASPTPLSPLFYIFCLAHLKFAAAGDLVGLFF